MSEQNQTEGYNHYETGSPSDKRWFEDQWAAWPKRVNDKKTTNLSFLYGGVLRYRHITGRDPKLSRDFKTHVDWLDQHASN